MLGRDSIALAEPGDPDGLAALMTAAITDADWPRKVMPEPTAFKAAFSASVMANALLDLYYDILARQAGTNRHGA